MVNSNRGERERHAGRLSAGTRFALDALAHGLPADNAGIDALFERIATHHDGEVLMDAVTELGARTLLGKPGRSPWTDHRTWRQNREDEAL